MIRVLFVPTLSAGVTYWLGRGPTARLVDRFGGRTMGRLKGFVGKNAFYASFMIRNVPSAPFIVVNMAFGAARASFWRFLAGCALGGAFHHDHAIGRHRLEGSRHDLGRALRVLAGDLAQF